MKKIAFVLYTNQGVGVSYLKGLPMTRALEKDLKDALKETYSVTFNWEEALKSNTLDAIILPQSFLPIPNETNVPEIKIPAILLLNNEVDKIKAILDTYFNT